MKKFLLFTFVIIASVGVMAEQKVEILEERSQIISTVMRVCLLWNALMMRESCPLKFLMTLITPT